jgi:SAM-dependent methyltransferase
VSLSLREIWDAQAREWARWVRTPGHDRTNELLNVPRLVELLPPPGRATLDLGCGEGRFGRALAALGHRVVAVDASPAMVALAAESQEAHTADAADLPFADRAFDLVTAFMSLQDIDDLDGAILEAGRVLEPGGRLCFCVPHPLMTSGNFSERRADAPFVVDDYLAMRRMGEVRERNGIAIEFALEHRPLEAYSRALGAAGLAIEALREVSLPPQLWRHEDSARWRRIPSFVHVRSVTR